MGMGDPIEDLLAKEGAKFFIGGRDLATLEDLVGGTFPFKSVWSAGMLMPVWPCLCVVDPREDRLTS
jgi:hypothetical protein